jgi:hypothetical protein
MPTQEELDLIGALTDHEARRSAAREYFDSLRGAKTAKVDPALAGAVIGGLATVGIQALSNMPDKSGTSAQERAYKKNQLSAEEDVRRAKREKRNLSTVEELRSITAKPMSQLATYAKKHPFLSALPAAAVGAPIGAAIGRSLK